MGRHGTGKGNKKVGVEKCANLNGGGEGGLEMGVGNGRRRKGKGLKGSISQRRVQSGIGAPLEASRPLSYAVVGRVHVERASAVVIRKV